MWAGIDESCRATMQAGRATTQAGRATTGLAGNFGRSYLTHDLLKSGL